MDFTGGISEVIKLGEAGPTDKQLFSTLMRAHTKRSLNCCSIQPDPVVHEAKTCLGLIKGHAYSITKVSITHHHSQHQYHHQVARARLRGGETEELVRVRNPWGGGAEWRGGWCDGSREWEMLGEGERRRIGLYFDNDGEWWMRVQDFNQHFDQVSDTSRCIV